ncbi:helix-turn-helix domain-containing protein [Lysinibacillus halotolerans]|uniref:Helix-turn-helix domain-containing protein n=1 Tax=Lysinibacillus halotolerans TaxID=1368476 RepID=A0A3M8HCP7_9BACI|nr:helix-turn-helix transcriptional regulator [Lysinibacillus halotolerans]RND00236.1 helix-turn-helix domain-containing protein [Lysinibacillus halotolerans]
MTLGERLKEARKLKGFTQIEAATKLGITNGALSGYERNYRDPDTEMLKKLANLYEVSTEWLLGNNTVNKQFSDKDEKDIAKRVEELRRDLMNAEGLAFDGEPISDEARESLLEAMEFGVRLAKKANKKFIPKKYRDKEE